MKCKKTIRFLMVLWSVMLLTNMIFSQGQEKIPDDNKTNKIIRMDLLKTENKKFEVPIRNIFVGKQDDIYAAQSAANSGAGEIRSLNNLGQNTQQNVYRSDETNAKKVLGMELKYLGYVTSLEKKVALILYNGEARAAEKGSILPGGLEIIDITRSQLKVRSPGSEEIIIKLEGEEQ